ncbi:Ppx/GppA phosphatase family protein [Tatumella sp. JGM118]|uniref:Ppx/GppA phosphatase family protein n=1 Tax=Tatumella terrea TaxID=419007 RepID=A0ABW1VYU4_9GAMM|nr:phosphatase [Tatumella sp. JGM118]MBS0908097.1 phosphatase [Tatumella sp. JGM118]
MRALPKWATSLLSVVPVVFCFSVSASPCLQNRAAIDIGSGSTKIAVAEVDTCQHQIRKMLYQQQLPVSYNDALMHATDSRLPDSIIGQGLDALKQEIKQVNRFHPVTIEGVATAVFRNAENGQQVVQLFNQQTPAHIRIISQQQEALLGFASAKAALNQSGVKNDDILVWDIGGGSMQMTTWDTQSGRLTPVIYQGKLASVTLKNYIVSLLKHQPLRPDSSPNPIGHDAGDALKFVEFYASNDVDASLKRLIPHRKIIGIGGVHDYSLRQQFADKPDSYTLTQLSTLAGQQVTKGDNELHGDYRATDVSNLLLVEGYMRALNIPEVTLVKASLVQGLLVR